MMNKWNSRLGLARTKSDQLVDQMVAAMKSPPYVHNDNNNIINAHIRKSKSVQLQLKLDNDDSISGATLSRASSTSMAMGLSFSFAGFTLPPDDQDLSHSKPLSDHEIFEDLEAGTPNKKKIEVESILPIYLKFTDVTYKVIVKGVTTTEEKTILHRITGVVNPGEMLALMGPSGSGKTTLLNILGGRLSQPTIGGAVTYNDQPFSKLLKSRIGFVTQDDVLFPHLTVKETLKYAAYLRLPKDLTRPQKEERAMDVIHQLGLERCQDTMVGGSMVRGVSGGERKRVCIGNEIVINPSLLFLDEPTSGLDSTTSLKIIQVLHDLAKAGKAIITSIHQPSSRLFHKFDKLILLGKGNLLYFGKTSEVMDYFGSIGFSPLIAMNPAEFLVNVANGNINDATLPSALEGKMQVWGNSKPETKHRKSSSAIIHEYLVEAYESTVEENERKKLMAPINEDTKSKLCSVKREWGASWWQQYSILFRRGFKEQRHEYLSWLKITQVLATAIILGLLWWQSGCKTEKELEDQAGLLFFIAVFWGFFPVFTATFTFPQERAMLIKERGADMYRLSAYFLARTTSDLLLNVILPLLFLLIVYFMAGLKLDAATFSLTLLTIFLSVVAAQGLGLAIGASLMDLKKATTLVSVIVMTFTLAGGYFVKEVPTFMSWTLYLSFNYHTYRLLLKIQYERHTQPIDGLNFDNGLNEVVALIAMVFGYRLLAYIFLRNMELHS